ncbi:LysM domain-containing protein [Dyella sp.]|uniref:LysM peptidoglycan-binding domain-containing protein n=1 Tax=Dyella sp. TaxID=1869338 RepID=UPI002ECFC812
MFPVDSGSPVRFTPPPPPPPKPHVVASGETVTSIARNYSVTPEELARGNQITVDTPLTPGQRLTLPDSAVNPAQTDKTHTPAPQTPAQKTDAAIAAYGQAVKDRQTALDNAPHNMGVRSEVNEEESAKVDTARTAMNKAIADELANEVNVRNMGVPGQWRTPTDQIIDSASQAILARHSGDAQATAEIKSATDDYQVQAKAQSLIPGYYGDFSPAEKLAGINLQGQPQAVVDAVLADPRVQGWIKDAANQIGAPYKGVDKPANAEQQAPEAAQRLADTIKGLPPSLAAAVVQQSMPTIQKIAQCEMTYGGTAAYNTMQGVAASLGNSPQAQGLVQQIAQAYVGQAERWEGFTDQMTQTFMQQQGNPALPLALANALAADGKTDEANGLRNIATQGLHEYLANNKDSPLKAYNDAHKAADDKNKELSDLLAHAGPLTEEQQQKFIKAFMEDPDNAKVFKADAQAAKKLANYMDANQGALLYTAGRSPDAAKQLYDAMQDLAQSGQSVEVLKMAAAIADDRDASKAFSTFSDYQTKLLPQAIASAQGQLLVEANGDTKTATQQLMKLADPFFKGHDGWDQLKESYEKLGENDPRAFTPEALGESFAKMGPLGRGLAMASIVVSSYNGANAESISEMINGYSVAGGTAAGLASGAVQTLADAGKFGRYTEAAEAFGKFAAKFVPGLSLIASTSAFVADFSEVKDNPVYAGALVGDIFSVVGSGLETTGVGEVPGALVNGLGMIISAPFELIGGIISGNKEQKEIQEEVEKYLGKGGVGLDEDTSKALAESDGDQDKQWLATGMTPEQIQDLAKDYPQLLQSEHKGNPYVGDLPALEKRTGMSGTDLYNMLKAADQGGTPGEGIANVMWVLGHPGWFPQVAYAQTKQQLIDGLHAQVQQIKQSAIGDDSDAQIRALNQAADYLATS